MYQHRKIHAAISNAISHRPNLILVDVFIDETMKVRGEPCIVFLPRGSQYKRPYSLQEIRDKLAMHGDHEGAVGEGHSYRHVYFCDETVPADIRDALNGPAKKFAAE